MKETTQEATLKSFGEAGFNKVRMCVFPKNYSLVKDEPALYPFEMEKTIKDKEGNERKEWDFDRFDPAFFQDLYVILNILLLVWLLLEMYGGLWQTSGIM